MARKTTRRAFLTTAAVATSGAILAACQPQIVEVEKIVKETVMVEGTPQIVEKVVKEVVKETVVQKEVVKETVVVAQGKTHVAWYDWNSANPANRMLTERTLADFLEENPDIEVELQGAPGGNYYEKLQMVLAAGIAPDVLNFETWRWQPFAKRGALREIDDLRERDQWNIAYSPRWEKWLSQQVYFRGKLYAQLYNSGSMPMFYLTDPFDEAGIPYPTADWTLDEFKEVAEKLTVKKNGVQRYGYQVNSDYFRLRPWLRMNGEQEWDTMMEPHTATWLQPTVIDALQWQLYDSINVVKCSPTPAMSLQAGGPTINNATVAMKMEGPWFLNSMQTPELVRDGKGHFGMVSMPKGTIGRLHSVSGHVQTLNAQVKHLEEAWRLLKFTGDAKCQKHVAECGRMPNTPEFIEEFWVPIARDDYHVGNTQAFIDAFETGTAMVTGLSDMQIENEVFNAFRDALVAGTATAAELLPGVNKALQEMCDAYWAED